MANFNLDDYVGVNERIDQFYKSFPNGRINTDIHTLDGALIIIKASVYRSIEDAEPSATGHAYEKAGEGFVNKTSHIENCETSAVGRALAFLGFEVKRGIASKEEMQKVQRMNSKQKQVASHSSDQQPNTGTMSDKQSKAIYAISKSKSVPESKIIGDMFGATQKGDLSSAQASAVIEALNKL